jgi:hypothetical protein
MYVYATRILFRMTGTMNSQNIELSCWNTLYSMENRMINERGAVGIVRIDRGNSSTEEKPAPLPLSPLEVPRELT